MRHATCKQQRRPKPSVACVGPARDDLSPDLRCAAHGRYLLFFRERDDGVRIVRILHGAPDLHRLFG